MTARFALPHILPGQAQKEWFHNEALARIDAALHPAVQAIDMDMPPSAPAIGSGWIVGAAPGGDWAGHAGEIGVWTEGGWRFVAPVAGMTAWFVSAGAWVWHDGDAWRPDPLPCFGITVGGEQVVGPRGGAIAAPAGGSVVDLEARAAIEAMLSALKTHGLIAG